MDIEQILLLHRTEIGGVTWVRIGGGTNTTVADFVGEIQGVRAELHLHSHERSNYWIVSAAGIRIVGELDEEVEDVIERLHIEVRCRANGGA